MTRLAVNKETILAAAAIFFLSCGHVNVLAHRQADRQDGMEEEEGSSLSKDRQWLLLLHCCCQGSLLWLRQIAQVKLDRRWRRRIKQLDGELKKENFVFFRQTSLRGEDQQK